MKKITLRFEDDRSADLFLEAVESNNKTRIFYAVQAATVLVSTRRKKGKTL